MRLIPDGVPLDELSQHTGGASLESPNTSPAIGLEAREAQAGALLFGPIRAEAEDHDLRSVGQPVGDCEA